jgi:hypothetical protein
MAGSRRLAGVGSGAGSMTVTSWAAAAATPSAMGSRSPPEKMRPAPESFTMCRISGYASRVLTGTIAQPASWPAR